MGLVSQEAILDGFGGKDGISRSPCSLSKLRYKVGGCSYTRYLYTISSILSVLDSVVTLYLYTKEGNTIASNYGILPIKRLSSKTPFISRVRALH